jgi:hypothetical protein
MKPREKVVIPNILDQCFNMPLFVATIRIVKLTFEAHQLIGVRHSAVLFFPQENGCGIEYPSALLPYGEEPILSFKSKMNY